MRILKVVLLGLLAVFALVAGLFTAVLVAAMTAVKIVLRRFGVRPASTPPPRQAPTRSQERAQVPPPEAGEVIDVVAHEVPVSSEARAKH